MADLSCYDNGVPVFSISVAMDGDSQKLVGYSIARKDNKCLSFPQRTTDL